jgi:hypothetical protein
MMKLPKLTLGERAVFAAASLVITVFFAVLFNAPALLAQTAIGGAGPVNPGQHPFVSASVNSPGVSLTTNTPADVTTVAVPPGDWQVCVTVYFAPAATTVPNMIEASISTTANTRNTTTGAFAQGGNPAANGAQANLTIYLCDRVTPTITTTYRAVANASFTTSTLTAYGKIQARRMR